MAPCSEEPEDRDDRLYHQMVDMAAEERAERQARYVTRELCNAGGDL